MKKIRFHLLAYFMKLAQLIFRIGRYINLFHGKGHVAISFRQFFADKGVIGIKLPKIYCYMSIAKKHIDITTNSKN